MHDLNKIAIEPLHDIMCRIEALADEGRISQEESKDLAKRVDTVIGLVHEAQANARGDATQPVQ